MELTTKRRYNLLSVACVLVLLRCTFSLAATHLVRRVQGRLAAESLDIFDALRVKRVYAPRRTQGESEH